MFTHKDLANAISAHIDDLMIDFDTSADQILKGINDANFEFENITTIKIPVPDKLYKESDSLIRYFCEWLSRRIVDSSTNTYNANRFYLEKEDGTRYIKVFIGDCHE